MLLGISSCMVIYIRCCWLAGIVETWTESAVWVVVVLGSWVISGRFTILIRSACYLFGLYVRLLIDILFFLCLDDTRWLLLALLEKYSYVGSFLCFTYGYFWSFLFQNLEFAGACENVDDMPKLDYWLTILKASGDYDLFVTLAELEDRTDPNFLPMLEPCDSLEMRFAFFVVAIPVWGLIFSIEFLSDDGERFSFLLMWACLSNLSRVTSLTAKGFILI